MYIFKNSEGKVYTSSIQVKNPKGSKNSYFKGFYYQFEEVNGSIGGFVVVCPVEDWVDSWLRNIQKDDTTAYAVKIVDGVKIELTPDPVTAADVTSAIIEASNEQ